MAAFHQELFFFSPPAAEAFNEVSDGIKYVPHSQTFSFGLSLSLSSLTPNLISSDHRISFKMSRKYGLDVINVGC